MICFRHILIFQHLLIWQKNYLKQKKKNNKLVNVIKSGLSDLKDKIKEMYEDEKN